MCHLRTAGYNETRDQETAANMHGLDAHAHMVNVRQRFANSQWVTFVIDLNLDLLSTSRDWPEGVQCELHFSRKNDEFVILSPDADADWKYQLKDLKLHLKKLQPATALLNANKAKMLKSPALYPCIGWIANEYKLEAHQSHFYTTTLFSSRVPSKTIYVFLEQDQYLGAYNRNPSMLSSFSLKSFKQRVNGLVSPHALEFSWNAAQGGEDWELGYKQMFEALSISSLNRGNFLTADTWKRHRFVIVMDNCASSGCMDGFREKPKVRANI